MTLPFPLMNDSVLKKWCPPWHPYKVVIFMTSLKVKILLCGPPFFWSQEQLPICGCVRKGLLSSFSIDSWLPSIGHTYGQHSRFHKARGATNGHFSTYFTPKKTALDKKVFFCQIASLHHSWILYPDVARVRSYMVLHRVEVKLKWW